MKSILLEADQVIKCPHCTKEFPLSDGISRQTMQGYEHRSEEWKRHLEALTKNDLAAAVEKNMRGAYDAMVTMLKAELEESKQSQLVAQARQDETLKQAREKVLQETAAERKALENEVAEKTLKIMNFQARELDLRREKKHVEEARAGTELELHQKKEQQILASEIRALEQAVAECQCRIVQLKLMLAMKEVDIERSKS